MMRAKSTAIAFNLLIFLALSASARLSQVDCNLELFDGSANASITLYLYSEEPVNYFSVQMPFQENAKILSVSDSLGPIKEYSLSGSYLSIRTNSSAKRKEEVINIKAFFSGIEKENFSGTSIGEFSLAAEGQTKVKMHASGLALYGFDSPAGFRASIKNRALELSGKGPLFLRFVYSASGKNYGRFVVFNQSGASESETAEAFGAANELYFIVPNILGIEPDCNEFPVVVLEDSEYDARINSYSTGTYITGGLIVLKASVLKQGRAAAPVILHELTHSFNAKVFAWNSSSTTWLDEGLAKFVEYIASRHLAIRTPNLFYGVQTYSDGKYTYKLEPSSSIVMLRQYYDNNQSFMYEWNTKDSSKREFGYAFAELFVRWYVREHGLESMHSAMRALSNIEKDVSDANEFTRIVLETLNTAMEPCKSTSESEMLACINSLNEFNPKIPEANVLKVGLSRTEATVAFDIWAVRRKNMSYKLEELHANFMSFFEKLIDATEVLSR